ncbi:polysaccharide deacetylase family protein [Pseudomonas chlororaphis]|uniref:polysaccharide deacetylase family protein n=1 Tax=Pseudomonas chlororaphis TaxID=587753 RepID=UPI00209B6D9F|nr:polysaccharide deacetylase family protein [Pseudomonas chlororaphis]MCO7570705.1 polysaccharide deacetylase family protein [Pseudomonas chlororaphis]MCO7588775.1 polysaccharide deacetylase family protein [Pseudomonas chlororaphis]
MHTTWPNQSIFSWLQQILAERFGHAFFISATDTGTLYLSRQDSPMRVLLPIDSIAFNRADSDLPFTTWDAAGEGWSLPLGGLLPAPGASVLLSPLIEPIHNGYRINYDIFGMTYWMLSRLEETNRTHLDSHQRFAATSSHAFKHGYLERPVVDEWLDILGQVIKKAWPNLQLKQHQPGMKVSHDVDMPSQYGFRSPVGTLRGMLADALKHRNFKGVLLAPWIRLNSRKSLHPADPANTFSWIMDVSERHGLVSAFYFICGRTDPAKDADYEPEHPAIRALMRDIYKRGHEIGLHPSYNTYQNPRQILAEAQRLKKIFAEENIQQTVWGGRMHYLRWEHPTTMQAWEQAGLTYDSTLGYADYVGFRCGTCHEYPAYDPIAGNPLNLRVRPLIAMESTVTAPHYMGLGVGEVALKKLQELKDICLAVGGCFTLLWHNSQFDSEAERELYKAVVGYKQTLLP